jgi:hypothetical protein
MELAPRHPRAGLAVLTTEVLPGPVPLEPHLHRLLVASSAPVPVVGPERRRGDQPVTVADEGEPALSVEHARLDEMFAAVRSMTIARRVVSSIRSSALGEDGTGRLPRRAASAPKEQRHRAVQAGCRASTRPLVVQRSGYLAAMPRR